MFSMLVVFLAITMLASDAICILTTLPIKCRDAFAAKPMNSCSINVLDVYFSQSFLAILEKGSAI